MRYMHYTIYRVKWSRKGISVKNRSLLHPPSHPYQSHCCSLMRATTVYFQHFLFFFFQHFILLFTFSSIIYCYFLPWQFEPYSFASVEGNDSFFPFSTLSEFVCFTNSSTFSFQVVPSELSLPRFSIHLYVMCS